MLSRGDEAVLLCLLRPVLAPAAAKLKRGRSRGIGARCALLCAACAEPATPGWCGAGSHGTGCASTARCLLRFRGQIVSLKA